MSPLEKGYPRQAQLQNITFFTFTFLTITFPTITFPTFTFLTFTLLTITFLTIIPSLPPMSIDLALSLQPGKVTWFTDIEEYLLSLRF